MSAIIKQQEADQEIQEWKNQERPERTTTLQGVLCHKWKPGTSEETVQFVLPSFQRVHALKLAYSVTMAGQMGQRCTLSRIQEQLWWSCRLKEECKEIGQELSQVSADVMDEETEEMMIKMPSLEHSLRELQ